MIQRLASMRHTSQHAYLPLKCILVAVLVSLVLTSPAAATVYDDFEGEEINLALWWISNEAGILSQSDGFLQADIDGPPYSEGAVIISRTGFLGDFEVVLDWRDFQSTTSEGICDISLEVHLDNDDTIYIGRGHGLWSGYVHDFFFSNGRIDGVWLEGDAGTPTTAESGLLKIARTGSTITTYYNEGTEWIEQRSFDDISTGVVTVQVGASSGDNGTFHVACDYLQYEAEAVPVEQDTWGRIKAHYRP